MPGSPGVGSAPVAMSPTMPCYYIAVPVDRNQASSFPAGRVAGTAMPNDGGWFCAAGGPGAGVQNQAPVTNGVFNGSSIGPVGMYQQNFTRPSSSHQQQQQMLFAMQVAEKRQNAADKTLSAIDGGSGSDCAEDNSQVSTHQPSSNSAYGKFSGQSSTSEWALTDASGRSRAGTQDFDAPSPVLRTRGCRGGRSRVTRIPTLGSGKGVEQQQDLIGPNGLDKWPGQEPNLGLVLQEKPTSDTMRQKHQMRQDPVDWQDGVVTVMVRQIPRPLTQIMFLSEVNRRGFGGSYDFLYLPFDMKKGINVGYGFVSFLDTRSALKFRDAFDGSVLGMQTKPRGKTLRVHPAAVQGYEANFTHFMKTKTGQKQDPQFCPLFFPNGEPLGPASAIALRMAEDVPGPKEAVSLPGWSANHAPWVMAGIPTSSIGPSLLQMNQLENMPMYSQRHLEAFEEESIRNEIQMDTVQEKLRLQIQQLQAAERLQKAQIELLCSFQQSMTPMAGAGTDIKPLDAKQQAMLLQQPQQQQQPMQKLAMIFSAASA